MTQTPVARTLRLVSLPVLRLVTIYHSFSVLRVPRSFHPPPSARRRRHESAGIGVEARGQGKALRARFRRNVISDT